MNVPALTDKCKVYFALMTVPNSEIARVFTKLHLYLIVTTLVNHFHYPSIILGVTYANTIY